MASNIYVKKLAKTKFFEDQLIKSAQFKASGMTNQDVKLYEEEGITIDDKKRIEKRNRLFKMFNDASKSLKINDQSAFVYEIQKLLNAKGHKIPLDGVFRNITSEALKTFEEKSGLYVDGKLDIFTLEKLVM